MLQSIETLEDGSIIGFWLIEETEDELITLLGNRSDLLDAMASFSSEKRRLEFVATRVLLKNMLKEEKTIAYTPDGYPFLTDNSYNISISHTGKYVGIILNKYRKVGIDIEKISDKVLRVRDKYLSEYEQNFVEKNNAKVHLTLMWCAKEAVYKIVNNIKIDSINQICISPFIPYIEGTMEVQETYTDQKSEFVVNYRVEPSVCKVWTVK
jgi:siderophore (surfactin) biosynthesis regulatory protein